LEAWLDEQTRATRGPKRAMEEARERFFAQAVEEAAHTLLNRLVFLRILEHHDVIRPHVVTGGFRSPGYAGEFLEYAGPLAHDDAKGYGALLGVLFDELALELSGLFGPVGLTTLFPVPATVLRELVAALNDSALDSAWGDDTTLGWVYQYWNDPEREALDAKISGGGKIEPYEIASKTQMFTERYIVEWLLQNSLGLTWLALCKKSGWTPDAEAVLPDLDSRRASWRQKRDAGEVALDALMPIAPGLESAWKYYVPQPLPDDAVASAPASIADVKLLDPACGSGHFLVIAFGLFAAMYEEEARHRGQAWTAAEIAERIVANNLHGIDIDARAIQIAAAALWLKAKLYAPDAHLARMNLVAPSFRLASLPKDDPARVAFVDELFAIGVPRETSARLVESLAGVDHLGTLLRVDREIGALLDEAEEAEGPLFVHAARKQRAKLDERVAAFLDAHAAESDLGLRLEGEQLAAGVRFIELVKEGQYDVVVGNPPYQGVNKTAGFEYVVKNYPRGKADLYAAFFERGLELVREGGISALVGMRSWMFLGQFAELRVNLLRSCDIRLLGDLDKGAFETMTTSQLISVVMAVIRSAPPYGQRAIALQPTAPGEKYWGRDRTDLKRAAILSQVGRYDFDPRGFAVIEGEPIVYWWTKDFLDRYAGAPKLGQIAPVKQGTSTAMNARFLRKPWEIDHRQVLRVLVDKELRPGWDGRWVPYVMGASGRCWFQELADVIRWAGRGLEVSTFGAAAIRNTDFHMHAGVAYATIGSDFAARAHRFRGVFSDMGASVFPYERAATLASMNRSEARAVLQSLNPTVHFQVGDVNRLPVFQVANANDIFAALDRAFTEHESHREPSIEFTLPGSSPWRAVQAWAQLSVDRLKGAPLPPYVPELDPPAPEAHVSFAIGVALGRFGAAGEGILDTAPKTALPAGILFIGPSDAYPDSLTHPSAAPILAAWEAYVPAAGRKPLLRDWLRKDFFAFHKALYENRPIYFPLSSEKKTFVAWVSIHRWTDSTLQTLLADHLQPVLRQLTGEIADVNTARASSDKKTAIAAEKQYEKARRLLDELDAFVKAVTECTERGAPPIDPACPPREVDASFTMDLDDGVMINSAALWPLLAPQWNDPKKWWKQLCLAEGRKDYDWAHLAKRYFPTRVDAKCKVDPSLAVAHGCFWRYHPAKAFAWELRLQDEIREGFTIDEPGSDEARAEYLRTGGEEADAAREKERVRRERKAKKEEEREEEENEAAGEDGDEGDEDSITA
jgi:hypothetical protein